MNIKAFLLFSTFTVTAQASAIVYVMEDSVTKEKTAPRSHFRITTRMHSKGMFAYSGRIVSDNPAFDVNFTYERKTWGYMFFKAQDLHDGHSDINFTLTSLFKNIHIGKKLTITPHFALRLEQTHSVVDKGSDAVIIIITAYRINKHFVIDNSSLFSNVMVEQEDFDWINRFRLMYTSKHIDATGFFWNNNNVFDETGYVSCGVGLAYSRIKVSEHLMLSAGTTALMMARTSDAEEFPKKNGFVFTIAATLNH